ncbi:hypothetical protein HOY82DRAFT_544251 [Tuber indicum]|nr:hypothetical protein HOY82DRAFT_544251 [Tuber indicum]
MATLHSIHVKDTTRLEDGRREQAEALFIQYNRILSCPGCGMCDASRGTFVKDCAGKKDEKGRRYRRFVCRITPDCSKSIGVSEFIRICQNLENSSDGNLVQTSTIQSTKPLSGPQQIPRTGQLLRSGEFTPPKDSNTDVDKLWVEIEILSNYLQRAMERIEMLEDNLSELRQKSADTVQLKSSGESYPRPNSVSSDENVVILNQADCRTVDLSMSDSKEDRHSYVPIPHSKQLSYSATLARMPKGIPYVPISEVKGLLAASPTRIQLRHIRNISWIDFRMVELLVDSNHSTHISNRISNHSEYNINKSFDPLSSSSFNWEANILPESQEAALKKNFVERLAASIASSSDSTTREHILNWAKHRNLDDRLEQQLTKQGILLPRYIPSHSPALTNLEDNILSTGTRPLHYNSIPTPDDLNSSHSTGSRKRKVSISDAVAGYYILR